MVLGLSMGAGMATAKPILEYHDHNVAADARCNIPTVEAGDLLLGIEQATDVFTKSIPAGWTELHHSAVGRDLAIVAKISDGTETGVFSLSSETVPKNSMCISFNGGWNALGSLLDDDVEQVSGNPVPQVKNISTIGAYPALVFCFYATINSTVDPRTFTGETPDGEKGAVSTWIKWFFADSGSSPSDITVDMDDENFGNVLYSAILELR